MSPAMLTQTDAAPPQPMAENSEPKTTRRKTPMALINVCLDAALLLSLAFLGWVSALLQIVFPAPTTARGWELWGLTFDQWRDVQFGALCVFGLLGLEHLALHWNWVCGAIATKVLKVKYRQDEGLNAVYGVAVFIGIVTFMLATTIVAVITIKRPPM